MRHKCKQRNDINKFTCYNGSKINTYILTSLLENTHVIFSLGAKATCNSVTTHPNQNGWVSVDSRVSIRKVRLITGYVHHSLQTIPALEVPRLCSNHSRAMQAKKPLSLDTMCCSEMVHWLEFLSWLQMASESRVCTCTWSMIVLFLASNMITFVLAWGMWPNQQRKSNYQVQSFWFWSCGKALDPRNCRNITYKHLNINFQISVSAMCSKPEGCPR